MRFSFLLLSSVFCVLFVCCGVPRGSVWVVHWRFGVAMAMPRWCGRCSTSCVSFFVYLIAFCLATVLLGICSLSVNTLSPFFPNHPNHRDRCVVHDEWTGPRCRTCAQEAANASRAMAAEAAAHARGGGRRGGRRGLPQAGAAQASAEAQAVIKRGRKMFTECAVCRVGVRGHAIYCLSCAHGGHVSHMREWFAAEPSCPTGASAHA